MLDFIQFNDDVCIYSSGLDEWGLPVKDKSNEISTKGLVREILEQKTMLSQKGKNVVVNYTVTLPCSTQLKPTDLLGINVDGAFRLFEILKISRAKDLSGEPTFLKVWI